MLFGQPPIHEAIDYEPPLCGFHHGKETSTEYGVKLDERRGPMCPDVSHCGDSLCAVRMQFDLRGSSH